MRWKLSPRIRGRSQPEAAGPPAPGLELSAADRAVVDRALPLTMTGEARLVALIDAVRHLVDRGVGGALVECGVWRGGSVLAMILTLQQLGADDRELWLFDTFSGMTEPTEADTSAYDPPALQSWREARRRGETPYAELFDDDRFGERAVRETLEATGYPPQRIRLVAGAVEETIPAHAPQRIALLRLDTDWYRSTRHELEHLYPRLAQGGVVIVDDYGHWDGARRAVDEYFAAHPPRPLLHRIDYTARIGVRP